MFNYRKLKNGSEAIHEAIGQFEDIAARIQSGVQDNRAQIGTNIDTIAALEAENATLDAVAARGASVAAKLRELVA
jgi:hypothetical protein